MDCEEVTEGIFMFLCIISYHQEKLKTFLQSAPAQSDQMRVNAYLMLGRMG